MWVKPAEAAKIAKSHRVPLSRQTLDVLAEARKRNRDALVFPGTRPGAMMGNVVMTQALRNAGIAASGHGFRSSFKGWAQQYDVDELLSEFALAHVEGSATVAANARDELLEKRRPVMQGVGRPHIGGRDGLQTGHGPLIASRYTYSAPAPKLHIRASSVRGAMPSSPAARATSHSASRGCTASTPKASLTKRQTWTSPFT